MSETPYRIGADPATDLFAPPTAEEASSVSALEGLRQALATPVETEPKVLRVPSRPGVTIRCHTHMTQEERKAWQKRATKKKRGLGGENEVDEMHFAMLVIANTCEAVLFNGVEAHDAEGTPLSFRHKQLWDMVGATDGPSCIRRLFGVDAHILLASGEVLLASGFDDDLGAESDPTALEA